MRIFYSLVTLILVSLPVLFIWMASDRTQEFYQTHKQIAQESSHHIADAISRFVAERRRLVTTLADFKGPAIESLLNNPGDETVKKEISEDFQRIFPYFIEFSIADKNGNLLLENIEGSIGQYCQDALKHYSKTYRQFPRVHPYTENYHFDIMVYINNNENIIFVSFNADLLGNIIETAHIKHHEFMLTYPHEGKLLIEVTEKGSRQHLTARTDFHLSKEETQHLLFQDSVAGTAWQIVDIHQPELFSQYRNKLLLSIGSIYGIFVIVLLAMTLLMRRKEKLKIAAEQHRYEFIGIVSHELRTPLTSIKGSLSLVSNGVTGKLPEKSQTLVDLALNNCERLIELVNDLLDIQKIESGKISLERKNINLSKLVKQAINDIESYGSHFSVTYQLNDLLPNTIIFADEGRMLQVMNNLLSNAAKYGKKNDKVDVSITSHHNKVRISISDNGNGISIELQNNVFEKFTQTTNTTNQKVKSSGLGLHIVKQIVTLHDGEIDFTTSKDGTTFFVDLPIVDTY